MNSFVTDELIAEFCNDYTGKDAPEPTELYDVEMLGYYIYKGSIVLPRGRKYNTNTKYINEKASLYSYCPSVYNRLINNNDTLWEMIDCLANEYWDIPELKGALPNYSTVGLPACCIIPVEILLANENEYIRNESFSLIKEELIDFIRGSVLGNINANQNVIDDVTYLLKEIFHAD